MVLKAALLAYFVCGLFCVIDDFRDYTKRQKGYVKNFLKTGNLFIPCIHLIIWPCKIVNGLRHGKEKSARKNH